jgi:hypothetical protein
MPRWARPQQLDEVQYPAYRELQKSLPAAGDATFVGMDMKSKDPASMQQGFYREGYNCRVENGGLETRLGSLCPGSLNAVQYNTIFGVGLFSNPNSLEWLAVAVASGVWFVRDGEFPYFIPLAENLTGNVEFSQCFDQFFLWQGPNIPPLLWQGDWSVYWKPFPPPTGGRQGVPNAYYAENAANRMLVPYGKDRIAVSDIADYTEYDWTLDDFQINQGESDDLVRVFPWQQEQVICFKRHSIFRVTGVSGDLSSAVLEKLPGSLGLVGLRAVCDIGGDLYFMSQSGVFKISTILPDTPQPMDVPVSDLIRPLIDAINWNAADLIRAQYRRDRLYFAIPLKNAIRNNCLIVYNLVTGQWESIDTFGDPEFRIDDLVKMDYNGERRLYAIDRLKGIILLLEQGKTDLLGSSFSHEYEIDTSVLLRGYGGPGPRNFYKRMELACATWNPEFTVTAYQDGNNGKVLVSDKTKNRTKYKTWNTPLWNPINANDDHANGRRQDYSVGLPLMLGNHGVQLERMQEQSERFNIGLKGRYIQFKIENAQGTMNIREVIVEAYEDEREPRSQI